MVTRNRTLFAENPKTDALIEPVRRLAQPLRWPGDLDPLMERIGDARYVLLGEASHGTAEFYHWRAILSRRLILEKGFQFIAVEGDWPDCYRVNQYLKGAPDSGSSARDVLHAFERWPTWMWANEEIVALAEWLRKHNDGKPQENRVGFYGLDVYSLWDSLYAIMSYLQRVDPSALPAARKAYRCFEPYGEDIQEYARATAFVPDACTEEVTTLLTEIRQRAASHLGADREATFVAEQNALVVRNAEAYYRAMIRGGPDSWNIRDTHMAETLDRLMRFHGEDAKAIVWAHNTHIGDPRYTDMYDDGMINLGQLVRDRHADDGVVLIGFGTHRGNVIAARGWDEPMERMPVPPGRPGSWDDILHRAGAEDKLLIFEDGQRQGPLADLPRGQRAIGVVYNPEVEQFGNYVPTVLPLRYDVLMFLDETHALHPLHLQPRVDGEVPETFPTGV